jgi:hypothetical protein
MRIHFPTLLLCALAAGHAYAGDDAGVVVTGEATLQPQLANQLEGWLREHGHSLVSSPLPPDAINTMIDCFVLEDEKCARGVFEKRAKSSSIVYARVDVTAATDGERDITVTGYWFEKGHDAIADRRLCEKCSDQNLHGITEELMAALSRAGQRAGHLKLTSSPLGARVLVDGKPAGVTPLDYELAPGDHQITISHPSREPEARQVTIRGGETTMLDVPMAAPAEPPPSRVFPAVLMGTGAALVVTGAVMLAIDEDPSPNGPPQIRNTGPAGLALGVTGGIALGFGAYLWFRHSDRATPVAAISHDGAYVGWLQRF